MRSEGAFVADLSPWVIVFCAAAVCYGWRALGVPLSRGLDRDGAAVRWLTSVSYAMLAAVAARMIVLPTGALAAVPDVARYAACGAAFAVFLVFRRNVLAGTATGFLVLLGLNLWIGAASG